MKSTKTAYYINHTLILCLFLSNISCLIGQTAFQRELRSELTIHQAQWITAKHADLENPSVHDSVAHYFYHSFEIPQGIRIKDAVLQIAGLGMQKAFINGIEISEDKLQPISSAYDQLVYYSTYNVDSTLRSGENAIGVVLGNGLHNLQKRGFRKYGLPKLWLQLLIRDQKDSLIVISSSEKWLSSSGGPIRQNNLYVGETTDYSKIIDQWATVQMDKSSTSWNPVSLDTSWQPIMVQSPIPAQRVVQKYEVNRIRSSDTTLLIDAGYNISGWLEIHIPKDSKGDIQVEYAELLDSTGQLDKRSLRGATSMNKYLLTGQQKDLLLHPSFCYHGFRYATIHAPKHLIDTMQIYACHVFNDLTQTGYFTSSDQQLNQLFTLSKRTVQNNYHDVPTDCPQRDERFGWLGDRVGTIQGEAFLYDIQSLYTKWIHDIQLEQRTDGQLPNIAPGFWEVYRDNITWPMGYITFVDLLHRQYDDIDLIREQFPTMKKWIDRICNNLIDNDLIHIDQYSDWSLPIFDKKTDPRLLSSSTILSTCSFVHTLRIMVRLAKLLSKQETAEEYASILHTIESKIHSTFLGKQLKTAPYSPTEMLLFLRFIEMPGQIEKKLVDQLHYKLTQTFDTTMVVGMVGNRQLLGTLSQYGHVDLAFQLATQKKYPSLGYMIENDATSLWETWHFDPSKSQNHVMLMGDLQEWYFSYLAGIGQTNHSTAYEHIRLKPFIPQQLDSVKAIYHSPKGLIMSHWKKKNQTLIWHIKIPQNTTGEIHLPTHQTKPFKLHPNYRCSYMENDIHYVVLDLKAGAHSFHSILKNNRGATKASMIKHKKKEWPSIPHDSTKNGWLYAYYPIRTARLIPLDTLEPASVGHVLELNSDRIQHRPNFWAMKYQAILNIPKNDLYFFYLQSDDGAELIINDQSVIRNDGIHYKTMQSGSIRLKKGQYPIEIYHFNWWSFNTLHLFLSTKTKRRQRIPYHWLTIPN